MNLAVHFGLCVVDLCSCGVLRSLYRLAAAPWVPLKLNVSTVRCWWIFTVYAYAALCNDRKYSRIICFYVKSKDQPCASEWRNPLRCVCVCERVHRMRCGYKYKQKKKKSNQNVLSAENVKRSLDKLAGSPANNEYDVSISRYSTANDLSTYVCSKWKWDYLRTSQSYRITMRESLNRLRTIVFFFFAQNGVNNNE